MSAQNIFSFQLFSFYFLKLLQDIPEAAKSCNFIRLHEIKI